MIWLIYVITRINARTGNDTRLVKVSFEHLEYILANRGKMEAKMHQLKGKMFTVV